MTGTQRYILLPKRGIRAFDNETRSVFSNLPSASSTGASLEAPFEPGEGNISVIDSINDDGAKLVEMSANAAQRTNTSSLVRAIPVVYYDRPNPRPLPNLATAAIAGRSHVSIEITLTDAVSGDPIEGADVVAFTDYAARVGASGRTDPTGKIRLRLENRGIERLFAYPAEGYWGAFRAGLSTTSNHLITMQPVDLSFSDSVRYYYGNSRFNLATGVRVGVIDTGVGPHNNLNILGGANTVTGEPNADWHDGDTHGTHVAGLIGANGTSPNGLQGVAPDVGLFSYRVFGQGAQGASNYAILKAMILASMNNCDIINLSLGGGPADNIVEEAVQDAREQGMLVIVAAGNDGRRRVNYPAAYDDATAVSAMGREGTFPVDSLEEGDVMRPPVSTFEPSEFVAGFSNVGPEIDVTGPGVGTLSTLPHNRYGPMSGTSMAAPVVAGAAVSLLSQNQMIYNMPRDRMRSNAIEQLLQSNCIRRGFGQIFEGYGLPDPSTV